MEQEFRTSSKPGEPVQGVARSGGLNPDLPAEYPKVAMAAPPLPPYPGRVYPTIYLDELDPIFKDGGRGPSIGRQAKLTVPKNMEIEDLLSMVEHAPELGRVAMKFHPLPPAQPGEPSLWIQFRDALGRFAAAMEERNDQPTTGVWKAHLQSLDRGWLPDKSTVRLDIIFEEGADWGDAGVDAALLRALPDLFGGISLFVDNQLARDGKSPLPFHADRVHQVLDLPGGDLEVEEAEPLVWDVECRAAFFEDLGKGQVMESFSDGATALLMTREAFKKKHSDFKLNDPANGPRALAQAPGGGGTCLFPVRFTDDYLAAEAGALAASERLIHRKGDSSEPAEHEILAAAAAHRSAEEEARKLGLKARTNRHAWNAGQYQQWAEVNAANMREDVLP